MAIYGTYKHDSEEHIKVLRVFTKGEKSSKEQGLEISKGGAVNSPH